MNIQSLNAFFDKAGGRFPLAALAQKRASMILKGAVPFVERKDSTPYQIALQEFKEDKISLALPDQKKERGA